MPLNPLIYVLAIHSENDAPHANSRLTTNSYCSVEPSDTPLIILKKIFRHLMLKIMLQSGDSSFPNPSPRNPPCQFTPQWHYTPPHLSFTWHHPSSFPPLGHFQPFRSENKLVNLN